VGKDIYVLFYIFTHIFVLVESPVKLFVGNLDPAVNNASLKAMFKKKFHVTGAKVQSHLKKKRRCHELGQ
jgi:hypothetical protein